MIHPGECATRTPPLCFAKNYLIGSQKAKMLLVPLCLNFKKVILFLFSIIFQRNLSFFLQFFYKYSKFSIDFSCISKNILQRPGGCAPRTPCRQVPIGLEKISPPLWVLCGTLVTDIHVLLVILWKI